MISLKWAQVNAWRLSQQGLGQRLPPQGLLQAVGQTMGIHAQVMSAAEMAIAARVDGLTPQDVQAALWQDRTLVKTWMMRQTLHLMPSADFPVYIAARQVTDINWPEIFEKFGIHRPVLDEYLAVAPEILSRGPLTRQQFVEAIVERLKSAELGEFLTNVSWGTAFKPLALHGELCFGPNDGQSTTFIRPRDWIGSWQEVDPQAAVQQIARHYLMVYGPTRPRNFQVWWWMSGTAARKAFDSIADETEVVDVEGWRATGLKSAIHSMQEIEPSGVVHLLPAFDAFTVGSARGRDLERLIARENQKKVYRPQGWVSAVLLVDGLIQGTWDYKLKSTNLSITVNLFSTISNAARESVGHEAERLGKFLNSPVSLEFSED